MVRVDDRAAQGQGNQAGQESNNVRNQQQQQQPFMQQRSVLPQNASPGNPNPVGRDEEDLYSPYDHQAPPEKAESFPPVNHDQNNENQIPAFPPVQSDTQRFDRFHHPQQGVPAFPPDQHTQVISMNAPPGQHQLPFGANVPPAQNHQQFQFHQQQSPVQMGHPVVQQTPSPFHIAQNPPPPLNQDRAWNSNLFDCMNDPQNAIITAFFPCVTFGQIAEIVDSGSTPCSTSGLLYGLIFLFTIAPCIMSCTYRTKLRAKYGLIESPGQDWVVHCFCEWCALCQEYRQLKDFGLDPAIGWLGNQIKAGQVNQFPMVPPQGQRMTHM